MQNSRFPWLIHAIRVSGTYPRHLLAIGAGITVAVLAWYPGRYPIVLLVLPAMWSRLRSRSTAFVLWAAYYLTGARDIPIVCERFFVSYHELTRPTALALGSAFWLLQAVVLALPWILPKLDRAVPAFSYAWHAMLATLMVTLPPVGIIGWLSPLHVASTLYPGWQLAGMGLGMAALCAIATPQYRLKTWLTWAVLAGLSVYAHWLEPRSPPPVGWLAVDTALGRFDQSSYSSLYARTRQLQAIVQRSFSSGATVVILPEEVAGLWRPAMTLWWRAEIERMRTSGQTLVIGTDLVVESMPVRYTDSTIIAGAGYGRLDSRQPVPAGLWRPGGQISAVRGSIAQPYLIIAGQHAAVSLCYEDLLWWPHWRTLLKKPNVVVSQSNSWFDSDLALSRIQQQSIASVARLAGAPLLRATNR